MTRLLRARPARAASVVVLAWAAAGCYGPLPDTPVSAAAGVAVDPAPAHVRRLTSEQYRNTLRDLMGDDVTLPDAPEPDTSVEGFFAVGASVATLSPRGVERFEAASFALAEQALATAAGRAALVPCEPAGTSDDACARAFAASFGRRAWRRPPTDEELDALVAVARKAAGVVGDFHGGLQYALAAILQSPHFLYRVELGEPDPTRPGQRRFTSWEMASRLSFLLWNTTPDDELLDAAAAGELVTERGVVRQAQRLLADPRAREGVRAFFTELLQLHALDALTKDTKLFTHMSSEVGPDAREETLLGLEHVIFDLEGDYRQVMTTRRTFLNRRLAAIYDVPAPAEEGFAETWLPADGERRGLLGQLSILALHAHPTTSSATLRGKFVVETLLCQDVPNPPAGLNTALPDVDASGPTLRDRVRVHLTDPFCASCHELMDPIGLGLERFDSLGRHRMTENAAPIDPAGELDGVAFEDASALAEVIAYHPDFGPCLVRKLYQYANGHVDVEGEDAVIDALAEAFARSGYRVKTLLFDLATSPGFRRAGEPG